MEKMILKMTTNGRAQVPIKFRHTFAVKAIMDNVPLNVLQQWLGHSSVFTTSVYTQITGMDTSEFMGRVK